MRKYLLLFVLLVAGCSAEEFKTVDQLYDAPEIVVETMSKDVIVHTVIGQGKGVIISEDERNKWVETDLSLVSQHPVSLVESNIGKVYKAVIVGFNMKQEKAYVHIKSSIDLDEPIENVNPDVFTKKLTYKERLQLKNAYKDVEGDPSEKIENYEQLIFTQNPDELKLFVHRYEAAEDKSKFVANDLLLASIEEAITSDMSYKLENVESVTISKTGISVFGEIVFTDAEGSETSGTITYTVTTVDGQYKIINIQLNE